MSSTVSMYMRDAIVRQTFRLETVLPAGVWVALTRRVPEANANADALDEPVGGSYARVYIPFGTGEWGLTGYNEVYNINPVVFPAAGNYWGLIAGYALCTLESGGGDTMAVGSMQNPLRVDIGIAPTVKAGGITFSLTD